MTMLADVLDPQIRRSHSSKGWTEADELGRRTPPYAFVAQSNRRAYHWQSAGELLQMAACRDGRFAFAQAIAQLPRALEAEGLI